MNRSPDDRSGELRALFFESAGELLQSLNEAGLELEARPADDERLLKRVLAAQTGVARAVGEDDPGRASGELPAILAA